MKEMLKINEELKQKMLIINENSDEKQETFKNTLTIPIQEL